MTQLADDRAGVVFEFEAVTQHDRYRGNRRDRQTDGSERRVQREVQAGLQPIAFLTLRRLTWQSYCVLRLASVRPKFSPVFF
jgi:hypothetical protein